MRELECRRGDRVLFAPISFDVAAGAIVWIRGANGQGKTTLLRRCAGLSAPERRASSSWAGAPEIAPRPLYLAHANALKDDLTVGESLRFLLHLAGHARRQPRRRRRARALRHGQPRATPSCARLSQGQRRRVALARLAAQRELLPWLLDEPFDALDAAGVELLAAVIAAARARAAAASLLTSHLPLPIDEPAPAVVQLREPALHEARCRQRTPQPVVRRLA